MQIRLETLKQNKNSIEKILKATHKVQTDLEDFISNDVYMELLRDYFSTEESEWMKEDYPKSTSYPERLIYSTVNGLKVRSKSEMLIAMLLAQNKLEFRYECQLMLGGIEIYPDFTVRHPLSKNIIYWEHFGMMDKPDYVMDTNRKIQTYVKNGIIPGENLILTYETQNNPLSYETVSRTIELYFK